MNIWFWFWWKPSFFGCQSRHMIKCYYDFSSTLPEEVRKWSQGQTYLECDDAFVYYLIDEIKDTSKSLLPLHKMCKNMQTHVRIDTHARFFLLRNNLCRIKMCVAILIFSHRNAHMYISHVSLYSFWHWNTINLPWSLKHRRWSESP